MTKKAQSSREKSLEEARKQFESAKAEAITLLEAIKSQITESNPESINWGHAGSMGHLVEELKDLAAQTRRHS